jgi:hypothetical protein
MGAKSFRKRSLAVHNQVACKGFFDDGKRGRQAKTARCEAVPGKAPSASETTAKTGPFLTKG